LFVVLLFAALFAALSTGMNGCSAIRMNEGGESERRNDLPQWKRQEKNSPARNCETGWSLGSLIDQRPAP